MVRVEPEGLHLCRVSELKEGECNSGQLLTTKQVEPEFLSFVAIFIRDLLH